MNKLIGFFALTGMATAVVVGCTVDANPLDITVPDGSVVDDEDSGSTPRADSGRTDSGTPDSGRTDAGRDSGAPLACAAAEPATLPFNAPRPTMLNACSAEEIGNIAKLLQAMQAPQPGATCLACAQTARTDAAWGPVLGGDGFPVNLGGCAQLAGAVPACAKAVQNSEDCAWTVCAKCEDDDFDACLKDPATDTKCTKFVDLVDTACPETEIDKFADKCIGSAQGQFINLTLNAFCGTGVATP